MVEIISTKTEAAHKQNRMEVINLNGLRLKWFISDSSDVQFLLYK